MLIEPFVFLSLAAALSFTCADLFIRKGLQYANHFMGATITIVGELVLFIPLIFLLNSPFPELGAHYLWVMIGGLCNPGLFLVFFLIGIHKIGVARAAPIKGMSPIFAALFALIFLGEDPAWYHLMGVLFVVGGIVLLVSGKTEGRWSRWDARWPLIAAIVSGFGAMSWKKGLVAFPSALTASMIGASAALVVVGAYTCYTMREEDAGDVRQAFWPYLLGGLTAGMGIFLFTSALQTGQVFRVVPLVQISPLFTVLFSVIFLRRAEFITWRVPAGAILTVSGVILVVLRV
ncbi:MAG: DMT family transporter [Nitrospinae bacterium]|nr:DMT family transporter [Nitrospinota bacterium]